MGVEFNWRSAGASIAHSEPNPPWRSRRGRRRLMAAGLALLAVVGGLYWRAQRGLAAARADLQRALLAEVLALQTGQRDLFLAALDDTHAPWLRYHEENFAREAAWFAARPNARPLVESVRLGAGRAKVGVVLIDGEHEWRSTWYYARSDERWRHAPPPAEFWGETSEFKSAHLVLEAQGPDREPAASLLAELEDLYGRLTALYPPRPSAYVYPDGDGVPRGRAPSADRIFIRSFPYGSSAYSSGYFPSPQLALEMWTSEEREAMLATSARLAVARAVLERALGRTRPAPGDWWLIESLALWHASAWQLDWRPAVERSLATGSFSRLLDVQGTSDGPRLASSSGQVTIEPACVAPLAYTLGEYLGATYPGEQLGAVVQAIVPGSSSWAALQSTLGLSRASLQAGWAAFLQERYGERASAHALDPSHSSP